jgi:hypothetical protein
MTPAAGIAAAVALVFLIALALRNFERIVNWVAGKFLPELDDAELRESIDRWNRRHGR